MNSNRSDAEPLGVLNICKPAEWTSRDVVNRVQKIVGKKVKVGHAGTLDPMATGVLLVCVGRATRLIPVIHEFSKEYLAGFTLGITSDTDDATGQVETVSVSQSPNPEMVHEALQSFVGVHMQTPPAFSAVKVQGRRAYKSARAGEAVKIEPRPVTIHEIELIRYQYPEIQLRIQCGSGTYIRSIARDLGQMLKTGGLMHALERTGIGPFAIADAISMEGADWDPNSLGARMTPVERLFEGWPHHCLTDAQIQSLRIGQRLELGRSEPRIAAFTYEERFAAILERTAENASEYRAVINWVPAWFA